MDEVSLKIHTYSTTLPPQPPCFWRSGLENITGSDRRYMGNRLHIMRCRQFSNASGNSPCNWSNRCPPTSARMPIRFTTASAGAITFSQHCLIKHVTSNNGDLANITHSSSKILPVHCFGIKLLPASQHVLAVPPTPFQQTQTHRLLSLC